MAWLNADEFISQWDVQKSALEENGYAKIGHCLLLANAKIQSWLPAATYDEVKNADSDEVKNADSDEDKRVRDLRFAEGFLIAHFLVKKGVAVFRRDGLVKKEIDATRQAAGVGYEYAAQRDGSQTAGYFLTEAKEWARAFSPLLQAEEIAVETASDGVQTLVGSFSVRVRTVW